MIKKKINQMIKEGKLRILDKNNVTEFKKDLEQEAELLILMGYDLEEAIKKAHYRLLPKRYTIHKKRKRIKPIPIGLDVEPRSHILDDSEAFTNKVLLHVSLENILENNEIKIVDLKMAGKSNQKITNQFVANTIGRSRQYVQYKLKEIQRKLKKYL